MRPIRLARLGLPAAAVLFLAACGGGDSRSMTATTPTATAAAPGGAESTPAAAPAPGPLAGRAVTSTATPRAGAGTAPTPVSGSAGSGSGAPTSPPTPAPQPAPRPTEGSVRFEPALGGRTFDRPVEAGAYPAGPDRSAMFVTEQSGLVLVFHEGRESTLIDLRAQVSRSGNEEGLLSVELDPAFTSNGHVWLYYSVAGGQRRTRLSRVTVDLARAPYRADPASELVVLEVPQPFSNHNGGAIRFGPDRMLYLGLGDGGSGGDPQRHGQNLGTLLGSVIRIDVLAATPDRPYTVPADNPFVGRAGARPEIWAWGLRNPWRMSFDPATGVLWLGDVGQNASEEVNVIERGGNYGWNVLEGFACFLTPGSCDRSGKIHPVVVYTQGFGKRECSITGGVVYRGSAVPALRGHYLYGDFCSGALWALDVESRGEPAQLATGVGSIASFARDAAGEVYVLAFGKPLLRIVAR